MSKLQTDDQFMYQNASTTDAMQASYENQLLDGYDQVNRDYSDVRIRDTDTVDLTAKPLSQQIGGDHYRQGSIQPIEYIHANSMDFFSGNVVKYITRWKYKNGLEDLKKAKHYVELLMEQEYGYNG